MQTSSAVSALIPQLMGLDALLEILSSSVILWIALSEASFGILFPFDESGEWERVGPQQQVTALQHLLLQ